MKKVMVLCAVLFCLSCTAFAQDRVVRCGDHFKVPIGHCHRGAGVTEISVAACPLEPDDLLIWSEKVPKEALFHAYRFAGIEGDDVVLKEEPAPLIRVPIAGILTKYGVFRIRGRTIVMKVLCPHRIVVTHIY